MSARPGRGCRRARTRAAACCAAAAFPATIAQAQEWQAFARDASRSSWTEGTPIPLKSPAWVADHDGAGQPIDFAGQSGVVVDTARVYAVGTSGGSRRAYAFDRSTGAPLWAAPVPPAILDSWSTPAIDAPNSCILVASGKALTAFDCATGEQRWQAALQRHTVNASPLVTSDRGGADRAFITDYDGFGAAGRLYCINVDPFDPGVNPFQPGQIVWSVVLGATSGNSPAYLDGVVYVASAADESGLSPGVIRAFDAGAIAPPRPLWMFTNPVDAGFFGGVSAVQTPEGIRVFAASYAFSGGQFAANLVKVDGAHGGLIWTVPCNRTDATPIALPGGRVLLSTGIAGFGSAPSIQLFDDAGPDATLRWDTALRSWHDDNANGALDPGEYLLVGGWTHQPCALSGPGGMLLYAGAIPPGEGGAPCTDLYALDLAREPSDPGFIVGHAPGCGSTPAPQSGQLFSIGAGGLAAFAGPCAADCDASGSLDIDDFVCFQVLFAIGDARADCDASGALDIDDFICFQALFGAGCP